MNEIPGYISAVIIGFTLGLIGGGGSILTVPALVYIVGVSPILSTAYSLFIVGASALLGSFSYMKQGLLHYKTAIVFSIPSFIAVYSTRKFIVPAIPEALFSAGDFIMTKDIAVMVFFAFIMLLASISMIKSRNVGMGPTDDGESKFNYPIIMLEGVGVGILTGLVGAGGGFLIIPALVLLARLPMKMAVGTSLLIIAAKSLIGFIGDIGNQPIDWKFLTLFTLMAGVGILLGSFASKYFSPTKLKQFFGWFVLIMAVYILGMELIW